MEWEPVISLSVGVAMGRGIGDGWMVEHGAMPTWGEAASATQPNGLARLDLPFIYCRELGRIRPRIFLLPPARKTGVSIHGD